MYGLTFKSVKSKVLTNIFIRKDGSYDFRFITDNMRTIKGPAIFLTQFLDDAELFDNLNNICHWASELGYKGVQIPTWDSRCFDLEKAADSKVYAEEVKGIAESNGIQITELSTHLLHLHATFSGALVWPFMYPWPQRPAGLAEQGFGELAKRWVPILDIFDDHGIDLCYEIHSGEDLHDGITFERFHESTGKHNRVKMLFDPSHFVLQQLDYLAMIDHYYEFIKMFHVKVAEYNPTGKSGVYGGWGDRPGRFRSLGDGQVDFMGVFSKISQ